MLGGNALERPQKLSQTVIHWNRYIFPLWSILKPPESSAQKENTLKSIKKVADSITNQG